MAFGGRELRLILSIQSYGTSNIAKLRRDIMSLAATTRAANISSAAVSQAGVKSMAMQVTGSEKLSTLNQRLLRQQAQQIRLHERLGKALQGLYTSQGAGAIMAQRKLPTRGGATARALALENKALGAAIAQTNRQIEAQTVALTADKDAMFRLVHAGLPLVLMQERAARAFEANIARLQQMEIAGRSAAHVGRTMQFAGLIATAGFGLAASAAANFSKQVGLAATQMRNIGAPISDTAKKADILGNAITDMMMKFPASAEEMTKAAYDIFSSMNLVHNGVVDVSTGLGLLEVANKAAVAGQVDLQEATGAMIPVLNNFDPGLKHVGRTMDEVFSIVRFGQMRLNDFATAMSSLAPIAASTGVSLKNMGGPFATLTLLMKNQQRAALGLGRLFELLNVPAFSQGFRTMGVEVYNANHQLRPLLDIMKDIVKVHPEVGTGQKAAIEFFIQVTKASGLTKAGIQGTIQARRAFALLATQLGLFADTQAHVNKNSGEMARAFKFMSQQPGVQWAVFINQMKAFAIVIGRAVLPVFLALGQKISILIKWFRSLNPHTRTLIVRFLAITGLFALFGGTIVNVVGSMIAMNANLALMRALSGTTAKSISALRLVIGTLAFAGAAVLLAHFIGIKRTIVDITVAFIVWKSQAAITFAFIQSRAIVAAIATRTAWTTAFESMKVAARSFMVATGWGAVAVLAGLAADYVMTHWDQVRAYFKAWWADVGSGFTNFWHKTAISASWWAGTIIKILPFTTKSMRDFGTNLQKNADKNWHDLNDTFTRNYNKFLKQYENMRKKKKSGDADLIKSYNTLAKKLISAALLKQLGMDQAGTQQVSDLAKQHAAAVKTAMDNMNNTIKTGVSNMAQMYTQFRQVNEQGLGQIFGGPTMQGILGNVFSGINDTLRQFGVQIPVPFQILRKDMDQQMTYFKRWRGGLDKLLKRGAPLALVQQIQQLGPNAIPMIEGLLGANPKQLKRYFKDFKNTQKMLDTAAQQDQQRQLRDWLRHGKDVAYQMLMGMGEGLRADQQNMQKKWKQYITDTFGTILRKQMATEVAAAMADAVAQANAAAAAGITTGTGGAGGGGGGRPGGRRGSQFRPAHVVQRMNAERRRIARDRARIAQLMKGGITLIEWQEIGKLQVDEARTIRKLNLERPRELASIRRQMHAQAVAYGPHRMPYYVITYMGDTITVKADGATPASVMKAMNKHRFRKRTQRGARK